MIQNISNGSIIISQNNGSSSRITKNADGSYQLLSIDKVNNDISSQKLSKEDAFDVFVKQVSAENTNNITFQNEDYSRDSLFISSKTGDINSAHYSQPGVCGSSVQKITADECFDKVEDMARKIELIA